MSYPQQSYPPPAKKRNLRWLWITLTFVAVICVGGSIAAVTLVGGAAKVTVDAIDQVQASQAAEAEAKKQDVKITSCKKNVLDMVEIKYTVKNSKPEVQSYWIQFEIQDSKGVRLGEAHGVLNDVQPNATAKESTVGGSDVSGAIKCVLVSVS